MSRDLIRIILLFILLLSQGGHAVAPEVDLEEMEARRRANGVNPNMQNLQILMKENQTNLEFLNVAISNMISPKEENKKSPSELSLDELNKPENRNLDNGYYFDFLKANQKDLEGSLYYYKGDYNVAYRPLRESQGKIKEMYESVLERHNEYTRVLVTFASNRILRVKDPTAKNLLRQAFRELKVAENFYTMGYNSAPNLFRNKISLYQEGIVSSRRARRFAMIALIEFATVIDEKKEFKKQKLNEFTDANYDGTTNNYTYLKKTLRNYIENKWLDGKITANVPFDRPDTATAFTYVSGKDTPPIDLMELLDDCYGIITYNRISVLEETNGFIKRDTAPKIEGKEPSKDSPKPSEPTK
jgi:hypothetical protein